MVKMTGEMGWQEEHNGRYELDTLQETESSSDGSEDYDKGTT